MNRRKAFTLAEILVVLAVVGLAMTLLLSFFGTGRRRSHDLDFQVSALQTTHLLRALMAQDLSAHVPGPEGGEAVPKALSLVFMRVPQDAGPGEDGLNIDEAGKIQLERVEWRFDPKSHELLRNGQPAKVGRFKELFFSWYPYRRGSEAGETMQVHCVLVPEEALHNPDRPYPKPLHMSFSFHCPQTTTRRVYDEWIGR